MRQKLRTFFERYYRGVAAAMGTRRDSLPTKIIFAIMMMTTTTIMMNIYPEIQIAWRQWREGRPGRGNSI